MKTTLMAAGFALLSAPAFAASITVSDFNAGAYDAIVSGYGNTVTEDFEGFLEGNVANGFATSVGTFSTLGGTGTGGTVTGADFDNNGSLLAVRDGNVYGRRSTTSALSGDKSDNMFLDSNDTYGISWMVSLGGSMFDSIALTISDAAEFSMLQVVVGEESITLSNFGGSSQKIVEINFDSAVSVASVFFGHSNSNGLRTNDGFSLDDIAVSEVPLPASALLLLGGLAGLSRFRKKG
ncbi:MAG: VPLPA-CTERM sorting domain-containing protein [Paracoccaceae bacterium]